MTKEEEQLFIDQYFSDNPDLLCEHGTSRGFCCTGEGEL